MKLSLTTAALSALTPAPTSPVHTPVSLSYWLWVLSALVGTVAPTACPGVVSRTRWSLEGAQAAVGWWERSVQCGICSMVVVQEGASASHQEP
jgi:hypothetical protein